MGVSDVAAGIADAIGRAKAPLSEREAYLVFILRGMPLFRDVRRLDLWDEAYREVAAATADSMTATEKLLEAVYELGAECLYGAYSESATRGMYRRSVLPLLEEANIEPPKSLDFSTW
jgi:hypothetical protein